MTMSETMGGHALIVQHRAIDGRLETLVRWFKVDAVQPHAQHPVSVTVWFKEPRKRTPGAFTMVPENRRYLTIEVGRETVYDSREDVPCDMDKWEQTEG
jgi:hypothetical protein